jgi:YfiH family protein
MQKKKVQGYEFYRFSNLKSSNWQTTKPFDVHKERGLGNRALLKTIFNLNHHVLFPDQKSTGNVQVVRDLNPNQKYSNCDALVSSVKNLPIGVITADCVPILVEDVQQNVVAAVHAGWRGTLERILWKAVGIMIEEFGCNPQNIYAGIGPSISPEVYEVGDDVYKKFEEEGFPNELFFKPKNETGKYLLDLWKANEWQLTQKGIPKNNVENVKMCTFTRSDKFYSARKEGIETGRLASIIIL